MGWEGGHWVLTETERERGREIRGGGEQGYMEIQSDRLGTLAGKGAGKAGRLIDK